MLDRARIRLTCATGRLKLRARGQRQKGSRCCPPEFRCASRLERLHVFGLPTLGAPFYFKADPLTFLQRAKAIGSDRREMHKDILAILARNEAKTFGIVKPLHS